MSASNKSQPAEAAQDVAPTPDEVLVVDERRQVLDANEAANARRALEGEPGRG